MNKELNSIGINKKPEDTTVVVAMSGGVDSSTVAGIMKNEGYNVVGITLKLYDDAKNNSQSRQCCAGQDILDAKRVANKLEIKHKILYYQTKFKTAVVDNFIDSYLSGETPIPCVQCNQTVKFKDLFQEAKDLNADALITGHYVKSVTKNKITHMYRANDTNRDQSYFLFNTTREQLNFLRFPLGILNKSETREIARKLDLNVADKPDSQDICFIPNGNYKSFIEKNTKEKEEGEVVDINNNVIGKHNGVYNFTIGQRKGLRIGGSKKPLFVLQTDVENNIVYVGMGKDHPGLYRDALLVDSNDEHWVREDLKLSYKESMIIMARIRYRQPLQKARLFKYKEGIYVLFDKPQSSITKGQFVAWYIENELIGSGVIS